MRHRSVFSVSGFGAGVMLVLENELSVSLAFSGKKLRNWYFFLEYLIDFVRETI